MAFPSPSLWKHLSRFVSCVILGMHPVCSHLSVLGMLWRRDAGWRVPALCYLGQTSCLGLEAQPRGLAEVRSVSLQPPFQGWKEGVKELPY